MQVFGGKFNYSGMKMKPRQNFDTFWQSLLTVFQVSNIANPQSKIYQLKATEAKRSLNFSLKFKNCAC